MTFFHRTVPPISSPFLLHPFFHARGFSFFFPLPSFTILSYLFPFFLSFIYIYVYISLFDSPLQILETLHQSSKPYLVHPPKVHSYSTVPAVSVLSTVLSVFSTSRWMGLLLKTSSFRLFVKIIGSYPSASSCSRREREREKGREGGESKYTEQSIMQK